MNQYFWNIVRADILLSCDMPMEWYFVRDANREIVCGPYRKHVAVHIASRHNDVVMAMMEDRAERIPA